MYAPTLNPSEVNHIRASLGRCSAEEISSELGRAKSTVEGKLREIKESERIEKLSKYAKRVRK